MDSGRHAPVSILHCITGLNVGGAELMLARYLHRGHVSPADCAVLSLMDLGPVAPRVHAHGVAIHSLELPQGRLPLGSVPALVWHLRRMRPRLIHGWMYHGNIAASIGALAGRLNVPVVWSIHHSLYDAATEKLLTRRVIRLSAALSSRTAAIIYCSHVAAAQHEALGFDPRRSVVIHNGIDCAEFRPDRWARHRLSKRLGLPPGRLLIGSVGRAHPMKAQHDLVAALALLVRAGRDVHGIFVGPGHLEGSVMEWAEKEGIADRISTLGGDEDVPAIMPGLDIHAISSTWGEAFSLATAEAMASGVPAVVTDVGDCPRVVGDVGLVARRGDPESLAASLAELIDLGIEGRQSLGARARQRILDYFSMEQYVSRHAALYETVLAPLPQ